MWSDIWNVQPFNIWNIWVRCSTILPSSIVSGLFPPLLSLVHTVYIMSVRGVRFFPEMLKYYSNALGKLKCINHWFCRFIGFLKQPLCCWGKLWIFFVCIFVISTRLFTGFYGLNLISRGGVKFADLDENDGKL